jgi:hypothetical protein
VVCFFLFSPSKENLLSLGGITFFAYFDLTPGAKRSAPLFLLKPHAHPSQQRCCQHDKEHEIDNGFLKSFRHVVHSISEGLSFYSNADRRYGQGRRYEQRWTFLPEKEGISSIGKEVCHVHDVKRFHHEEGKKWSKRSITLG